MGEFFTGWRRKAGLVMLGMALACMSAWVRSLSTLDVAGVPTNELTSVNGGLFWERMFSTVPDVGLPNYERQYRWYSVSQSVGIAIRDVPDNLPRWRFLGFGTGEYGTMISERHGLPTDVFRVTYWRLPYWSLAWPLTLLSAWLILGKTRKTTAATPNHHSAPSPSPPKTGETGQEAAQQEGALPRSARLALPSDATHNASIVRLVLSPSLDRSSYFYCDSSPVRVERQVRSAKYKVQNPDTPVRRNACHAGRSGCRFPWGSVVVPLSLCTSDFALLTWH